MIPDSSKNHVDTMFSILEIDPVRANNQAMGPATQSGLVQSDPDATIRDCVVTLGQTLVTPSQKPAFLREALEGLGSLGEFAVAALPQVGRVIAHKDPETALLAVEIFAQLSQMAINGNKPANIQLLSNTVATLADACHHENSEVQVQALGTFGSLNAAAARKGQTSLVEIFDDNRSQIATPASACRSVRLRAAEILAA